MNIILLDEPILLSLKVSTDRPLYEIGRLARFAHSTTEETFLSDGIQILHQDVFSVAENIGIEVECKVSERLARQINRHRHISIVQKSTRYNDYVDKDCVEFHKIQGLPEQDQFTYYQTTMELLKSMKALMNPDSPRVEQLNYLLPLSTITKVYYHMNLRTLIHMCNVRLCKQALPEFNDFLENIKVELSRISPEWHYIAHFYLVPACVRYNTHKCVMNKKCSYFKYISAIEDIEQEFLDDPELMNIRRKLLYNNS